MYPLVMCTCVSVSPAHSSTPEMRVRYWNAYLLFYEAVQSTKHLSIPRRVSGDASKPLSPLLLHGEDKLQQLQVRREASYVCVE